jgi:hypothetical protein
MATRYLSRAEVGKLIELSARSVANNEVRWGLAPSRRDLIQGKRHRVRYLRREALAALRERGFLK